MVSASDLQRDSARIISLAMSGDDPVFVVKNNRPQAAVINLRRLKYLIDKTTDWETRDALEAIRIGEKELKQGKLKSTTDFSEFLND
ncbi:MAG: hypothetical protein G01um101416_585 [Microgenomates group bacterium Gr01-1014_16]|nr:MAG: hypothetical protein G01um101416_585 [Microgenomates group bacterium Gr01-1014_16]